VLNDDCKGGEILKRCHGIVRNSAQRVPIARYCR
jgi:hypothetical protein